MNKTSGTSKDASDKLVRGIKRKTRKHYSAEGKSGSSWLACGANSQGRGTVYLEEVVRLPYI